jgi:adenylate cyclase
MSEERAKRKLSGILSADAVGYSRLMEEDEAMTISTLEDSKKLMSELIQQFKGRIVDAPGDNLLAEFGSVVDATECAVKIQKELKTKNAELPDNRKMEFRIGVNLGDVVEEADRIYGNGINIAARIEGLAEPGGICISRTAYDHVKNKLELGYEYLGEHHVKNIAEQVRVYRVLVEPEAAGKVIGEKRFLGRISRKAAIAAIIFLLIVTASVISWNIYLHQSKRIEPASLDKMAHPLPDKPSIAVLAFVNLSGDPAQEYFSDGITEEIITALSKVPKLFVIARNSTFTYKGKPVKIQQVSEELGVRYVLEGSVRKSENRVRITAQLVDATSGLQLWAERYDTEQKDIFILQDEIAKKILAALQVELTEGEVARSLEKGTNNLEAYLKVLKGREYYYRRNKEGNFLARQEFEEAIALDSNYAYAHVQLAQTYFMDVWYGTKSPKESLRQAIKFSKKAISLDENLADARSTLGYIYTLMRQHEKAIVEGHRAVELAPNSDIAHLQYGASLNYYGKHEEAVIMIEKAIRLNPMPPSNYYMNLGTACYHSGKYEQAVAAYKKCLQITPNHRWANVGLTVTYSLMGHEDKARAATTEVLRINPNFSVEGLAKKSPYKNQEDIDRFVIALRKAGLK